MAQQSGSISLWQGLALALMRIAVGWHFLYEGVVKFLDEGWTAAGYLQSATGPAAGLFQWIASNETALRIVDQANIWALILIGGFLMLGLFTRLFALLGIGLLALYYVAHPPLFSSAGAATAEGTYLLVNKNLVEMLALCVVFVLPARGFGFDGLIFWRRGPKKDPVTGEPTAETKRRLLGRRQVLASLTGLPFVGAFVLAAIKKHQWDSHEEANLQEQLAKTGGAKADAISQPSKTFNWKSLDDLEGKISTAKIGDVTLSRIILGGNLIGGWAHARDLIYVSSLVKSYHTRDKISETFRLAEACGVNTILTNPILCTVINDYWKNGGGKIQFISDCGGKNVLEMTQKSIDNGACACYVQGETADRLVEKGDFDTIAKVLELTRKNGLPAGIGGHKLATIQGCVEQGLQPDFWMKTLHSHNYWSAKPEEKKDNIWCEEPEETIAFMKDRTEPWIAFKTLAAGALRPRDGFTYAFENGADFVCVGMYDFQMVDDINIARQVLDGDLKRGREWFA